jgi:hypothetical protein
MMQQGEQTFLAQCHDAFRKWLGSVPKLEERFDGNFVAVPEVDNATGEIRVASARIVDGLKSKCSDAAGTPPSGSRGPVDTSQNAEQVLESLFITEVKKKGPVYIGEEGYTESLSHGSVVALHCCHHNRFLRLHNEKAGSSKPQDINQLPRQRMRDLFLVVKLGSNRCAFYNIGSAQFLGMNGGEQLVGL